ncbi:hypothetical protein MP228_009432 [Amoeboaphelidium protococcarum]|nr:hypothetical protein MP228_009432 [Amoeboaphelidium protococcarum]
MVVEFVVIVLTILLLAVQFYFQSVKDASSGREIKNSSDVGDVAMEDLDVRDEPETATKKSIQIWYGTQTFAAKEFSLALKHKIEKVLPDIDINVMNLSKFDDDVLTRQSSRLAMKLIIIIPTYENGTPPDNASLFYQWLDDFKNDFRVSRDELKGLEYAVFGLGHSDYKQNFNAVAKRVDFNLASLGAQKIAITGLGDFAYNIAQDFDVWSEGLVLALSGSVVPDGQQQNEEQAVVSDEDEEQEEGDGAGDVMDLEDVGNYGESRNQAAGNTPREMVNPMLHKSLTKQGYKIVGSHSGVKICRWTKSMLRGRGGCYKHTFYGIASHQCMETTPSLACANKCVFCWRHHTNPVGTTWRWKIDDPKSVLDGAIDGHYSMIKQLKGVPGVQEDRMKEAFDIRHCALSLVGEPIMYPHINEFVEMLHARRISSFLVTNAQFPEMITNLSPATQLYVSVDAATKESLKKIDRPLFEDFWERFVGSLDAIRDKGQRTVYRLTLVKDYNTEDLSHYCDLIRRGQPDFIEVKGVTFCGFSASSPIRMSNVPYQHEVVDFVKKLIAELGSDIEYEIACEHEHSCSVLVAHKKFYIDDKWHTWIDYDRFHDLIQSGVPFDSLDYVAPTPDWAVYGNQAKGFDPEMTRHFRKQKAQKIAIELENNEMVGN